MEQDHSETFRQAVDKVTDVAMMFPADYEISDFVVTLFMGIGGICDHVRTSRTGIATISDKAKDIAQVVRKGCRRQYPELPSEHIDELAAAIVLFAGWLVDHLPKREDDELAMALDARCYNATPNRTKMKPLRFSWRDLVAVLLLLVFFLVIIFMKIGFFGLLTAKI